MARTPITEADYWNFVDAARRELISTSPESQLEVVGSLANGNFAPGYSDLDLRVLAPMGKGRQVRDQLPHIAAELGELLTIFVDPYSSEGVICSVYPGPFLVDWFVSETTQDGRSDVWSGTEAPPYDPDSHPWDWIWWLWGKVRREDCDLGRKELSKLWQFLVLGGVSPAAFPFLIPEPRQNELEQLIVATLKWLPCPEGELAREISKAIREDYSSS